AARRWSRTPARSTRASWPCSGRRANGRPGPPTAGSSPTASSPPPSGSSPASRWRSWPASTATGGRGAPPSSARRTASLLPTSVGWRSTGPPGGPTTRCGTTCGATPGPASSSSRSDPASGTGSTAGWPTPMAIRSWSRSARPSGTAPATSPGGGATGVGLGDAERRIIATADSAFVASANAGGLLDASHRGGRPGFVEVRGEQLWIPDYPGNGMFMTLGNLRVHPPAGLLFVDFAASESLQLTGVSVLDLDAGDAGDASDGADSGGRTGGTGRAWTFTPTAWRRAPLPRRVQANLVELSPHNP